ncbi:hypothetical protein Tco_1056733 [Tanacetum coccineum]|uniref:Uncharacterized protein n=1 Tax=Tanacetum coccineum TaxID=301880 RepID=A0ABQ5H4D9_9ASTR
MAITYAIFEGENSESNVINTIRKGNLLLDLQKLQKNPIFCISVDIRRTPTFLCKTEVYSFQVNEHWLTLSADLLQKALNVNPEIWIHIRTTRKLLVVEVEGKGSATDVQATKSLLELHKPKKQRKLMHIPEMSFLATNYPKVHESLKHTTKEHVHLETPPAHPGTLSSNEASCRIHKWGAGCERNGCMIKRSKCENKGIVPTEMELALEYTQQGASHEVSKPGQYICCQNHKLIVTLKTTPGPRNDCKSLPSHSSSLEDNIVSFVAETISCNLCLHSLPSKGSFKDGDGVEILFSVKASTNSDIIFFFTSAQDGYKLLDDERLSLADNLKKAHDQNQNKSK